jgi:glycine/D-amino acid oxidase-like deaminating enzyme/nitrite reductase/ring-hydroxylating ferredoxin subunit
MESTGVVESYWLAEPRESFYAPLTGEVETDVAVVGGGIAGLCTAWELTKQGHRVMVLEAGRIIAGVTGHTTAKVSALHTTIYARLAKSAGEEAARLYAESQQDAIEHAERTAAELGIDCEWERRPAYTYVTSDERVDRLRAEAETAVRAGLPASFVTDADLPFPVAGAVRVEDQAQFHPRRYLLGLVDAIIKQGGIIHEQTRVRRLVEGAPCRLTADNGGTVRARAVVVATHYPVFDRALLFARLTPHRELVIAAPLPADQDPQGMYITPEENTRSVRTAPFAVGRRLLIVTGESFTPGAGGRITARYERLTAWARERFGIDDIAYRWAAQDNHTTDRLPFTGLLHPGARNVYVTAGYGGWGMTNAIMSARLLADLISGQTSRWAGLYDPRRLNMKREAGPLLKAQAHVTRHFIGDRLRDRCGGSLRDLTAGTGAVVRIAGEHRAVYRDENGELHALSATCTHLGCLVAFNDAERAWECPCHGSRFAMDGSILQGPANRPLEPRDAPG